MNKRENTTSDMTVDEKIQHERTGHTTYDSRCETCLKVRGVSTHLRVAVAEAAYFDYETVKNSQQGAEVKIWVGAGRRGETLARAVHCKGAKFEDLERLIRLFGIAPKLQQPVPLLSQADAFTGSRECSDQLDAVIGHQPSLPAVPLTLNRSASPV